jgi:hypothetical protein
MDSDALLVQGRIDPDRLQEIRLPAYHQVRVLLLRQMRDIRYGLRRRVHVGDDATYGIQFLLHLRNQRRALRG